MAGRSERKVLALSGGVGGAKLALGLAQELAPQALAVLVNTGDDFRHHGLHISPDIDTLLYTLSGRSNREQGWGLEGESWQVREALSALGVDTWFQLGDRDMATHLLRTGLLDEGQLLSAVTHRLASAMGIATTILPMAEEAVSTVVHTDEGDLPFQHYFVRRRCEPAVSGFSFRGLERARPPAPLQQLLASGAVATVVICPSNPFVSIDPILGVPGLWQQIAALQVPVLAVSPIVGGRAVKGPAAKMMAELGLPVDAAAVVRHYRQRYPGLVTHFVLDREDADLAETLRSGADDHIVVHDTLMQSLDDKRRLAQSVLQEARW
ncbi:2-phospho-L-lactate transferase [Parahaliea aestuarii]|uniref:2-phospho-L-lactate transferase n=1 Tax=Parahaliea aestuarii TaxID=1852021 RepID=A0A5C8ZSF4_9GAMM|nr:2-phospho-L-lactate transferase [Parahaliea aestuarii]TXS91448.1 2-phospho-L-lactate transferase [Parahaliea aestuarii]